MKEGNKVRLKGKKRTAIIVAMLSSIDGGVFLDRSLNGYRYWNVEDLERAK